MAYSDTDIDPNTAFDAAVSGTGTDPISRKKRTSTIPDSAFQSGGDITFGQAFVELLEILLTAFTDRDLSDRLYRMSSFYKIDSGGILSDRIRLGVANQDISLIKEGLSHFADGANIASLIASNYPELEGFETQTTLLFDIISMTQGEKIDSDAALSKLAPRLSGFLNNAEPTPQDVQAMQALVTETFPPKENANIRDMVGTFRLMASDFRPVAEFNPPEPEQEPTQQTPQNSGNNPSATP